MSRDWVLWLAIIAIAAVVVFSLGIAIDQWSRSIVMEVAP